MRKLGNLRTRRGTAQQSTAQRSSAAQREERVRVRAERYEYMYLRKGLY